MAVNFAAQAIVALQHMGCLKSELFGKSNNRHSVSIFGNVAHGIFPFAIYHKDTKLFPNRNVFGDNTPLVMVL